ncbi:type III secretion protein [Burkholderia sp. BE17]|nr:type III secretion protein [Burkholderia sp. BE17]
MVCDCASGRIAFTPPSIHEADDLDSIRVSMMRFGLTGSSTPQPD